MLAFLPRAKARGFPARGSYEDVQNEVEKNRLRVIETDEDVKKLDERDRLKTRWIERKCKLYRRLISFYDEKRVYSLDTMERIETQETKKKAKEGIRNEKNFQGKRKE